MIGKILRNRNSILVFAVVIGLFLGDFAVHLKEYTIWVLALVMMVSTTGISVRSIVPLKNTLQIWGLALLFNYVLFSAVALLLAWMMFPLEAYFYGFVIIAFSPPGIAVIPFTHILNGNSNYTIMATLGSYLAAVVFLPVIYNLLPGESQVSRIDILLFLVKIIIIPVVLSRFLLYRSVKPLVEKYRGRVTDWGFAFIIFVAVGLNRHVFFDFSGVLIKSIIIILILTFGLGCIYQLIINRIGFVSKSVGVSQKLLLTIKSSGFTATTAIALFGNEAAIPSAVLAVMVLVYLIFLGLKK